MSITEVTIVRRCARCRHEVGVITVKKGQYASDGGGTDLV